MNKVYNSSARRKILSPLMLCFSLVCVIMLSKSATALNKERLQALNYEKAERPFHGKSSVNITVQVYIYMVGPIDEEHFTFESGFYLRQWWRDPRLQRNDSSTLHATSLDHLLWIPDTTVFDARSLTMFNDAIRTVIEPNGVVYTSRRLSTKTHCNMDLSFYPMDTQTCALIFENFAFTTNEVNISWHQVPLVRSADLTLDGYELMEITTNTRRKLSLIGNTTVYFKLLEAHFTVKRTFMYHIYRTYIPSLLLLIFAFGTFWVPDTAVPARMGMIVTSFLANVLILQAVSEKTVKVPYTTPMQMFLVVNITLIVFAMVEYLIIMHGKNKIMRKSTTQVNFFQNKAYNQDVQLNKSVPRNKIQSAEEAHTEISLPIDVHRTHIVDKTSRLFFPLTYVIFCAVYFVYYTHASS
ncbi:gamma-aminobutyric acid receptor subunit rho-1-like [Hydractinia symbiolongicarpus]|uniref:gamma-aminobutyric acid receptor subunit rho-1-like n=1 Tax=Hydractinia symbiolongicarpus TaxID=13093 RepID=UPI00254F4296|nr:gamma-aminobutyric acid receptor subunit rho-1-like [Hydractinia symbiolongicarpus]